MNLPRLLRPASALVPLLLACLAAPAARAQSYSVSDLGTTLYSDGTVGNAVNNAGQVVGNVYRNGLPDACVITLGSGGAPTLTDLSPGSFGNGINNAGQIAATIGDAIWRAELYTPIPGGGLTAKDLGTLGGGQSHSAGINASGQVCGYSQLSGSAAQHAFLYTSGTALRDLGVLSGGSSSYATGINTAGQVCGYGDVSGSGSHAFLWTSGTMQDLGTLPGDVSSQANGVGPGGAVVGYSSASLNVYRAFVYSGGAMHDLGSFGGPQNQANAVSAAGQIVGYASLASGVHHAFLYTTAAGLVDLNTLIPANSGWTLTTANGISDNGYITGTGTIHGATHAFLLKPGGTTPAVSWKATALASGPDGNTRVVWDKFDGTATVWKVSPSGQLLGQQQYGPYSGYAARAVSSYAGFGTGADAVMSLLLFVGTGPVSAGAGGISFLGTDGLTAFPSVGVAPATAPVAQGVGGNHAFWANPDGTADVWTVSTGTPPYTSRQHYGPYAGWTARSLTVNPDGTERLLWTNMDGTATVWRLNASNQMTGQTQYGPYSGWTAQAVASAPDGTARVVWVNTDTHIALWTLNSADNYTGQTQFGPYSGWTFQGLSVGSDGNARLLWDNITGQAALWSITPSGGFASNTQYGPY